MYSLETLRGFLSGSSSSNFFNNKNGGKENDDDYEDSAVNRNVDVPQRKVVRKPVSRKPVEYTTTTQPQPTTSRPNHRQTGFVNNFAGSPYVSATTGRSVTSTTAITNDQYTTAINNYRVRQRGRQYSNADTFRNGDNGQLRTSTPNYSQPTQSTPAPFRQQYKNVNRQPVQNQESQRIRQQDVPTTARQNYKQTENYPTTSSPFNYNKNTYKKETENYPTGAPFSKQTYSNQYDIPKTQTTPKQTENYPTTTNFKPTYNNQFDKKPTTFKQTENYPTTYSPKKQSQYFQKQTENYPTTTEAKTNYDQYNNRQTTFNQNYNNDNRFSNQYPTTPRPTTVHTQYTPTVPKQTNQFIYTTTPATRYSKPFDDTHYDDGSYNPKYDDEKYKPEEEFLKTAHSQNFASSRNELSQSQKISIPIPTKEPPRPFSASTPPATKLTSSFKVLSPQKPPQPTQKLAEPTPAPAKKEKNASYDYAYYDTNVGSEPEYDIDTEFARSTKKE